MPRKKVDARPVAFQFYPNDWLSSPKISIMTPAEEGAYIRLLAYCWMDKDFCLPDDDVLLAKLSRLGEAQWKGSSTTLRACFTKHPTIGNKLVHERLLKERDKQLAWKQKSRDGGIKSGKVRRIYGEPKLKGGSRMVEPNTNSSVFSLQSSSSLNSSPSLSSSLSLLTSYSEQHVLELWNARSAAPCKKLSGTIKIRLARQLREHPDREWWEALVARVQASDFLSGRAKDFVATLDWVIGPKNLAKIEAGNYDNRATKASTPKSMVDLL